MSGKFELGTFVSKSMTVKAVQITRQNIAGVALWCHGMIAESKITKELRVVLGTGIRTLNSGVIGDWVVFRYNSFDIVSNEDFTRDYMSIPSPVDVEGLKKNTNLVMPELDPSMTTRERVNVLVRQAMIFQDRISHVGGDTQEGLSVAEYVTDCIVRLYE